MWWEIAKVALIALFFCWGIYWAFIRPKLAKKKKDNEDTSNITETSAHTPNE